MNAEQARRSLDRMLANVGQTVTLQRLSAPDLTPTSVSLRAHIVDFRPTEIDGARGLQIGDSRVIMSATELNAAQWPSESESRLPRKGDRIIVGARTRTVLFAWPGPYVGDELIRVEAAVR